MIVGGYTMDLYCDNGRPGDGTHPWSMYEKPTEFAGHNRAACVKQARDAGWIIDERNRRCYCPTCAKLPLPARR